MLLMLIPLPLPNLAYVSKSNVVDANPTTATNPRLLLTLTYVAVAALEGGVAPASPGVPGVVRALSSVELLCRGGRGSGYREGVEDNNNHVLGATCSEEN